MNNSGGRLSEFLGRRFRLTNSGGKYVINFIHFAIMGGAAAWALPNALVLQIPDFQIHNPEGLCITAYLNIVVGSPTLILILYVYYTARVSDVQEELLVPFFLLTSIGTCIASAFVYDITIDGWSVPLYICGFLAGLVGTMSAVVFLPFMTAYENDYISASRFGSNAVALIAALIASIERPGSPDMRFPPSVFFLIFSCFLIPSICSYYYIIEYKVGLRRWIAAAASYGPTHNNAMSSAQEHLRKKEPLRIRYSSMFNKLFSLFDWRDSELIDKKKHVTAIRDYFQAESSPHQYWGGGGAEGGRFEDDEDDDLSVIQTGEEAPLLPLSLIPAPISSHDHEHSLTTSTRSSGKTMPSMIHGHSNNGKTSSNKTPASSSSSATLSPSTGQRFDREDLPWFHRALPYMLIAGWIDFHAWGLSFAVMPFAMDNATALAYYGEAEKGFADLDTAEIAYASAHNLATAFQWSSLALILGDLSTLFIRLPMVPTVFVFTLLCIYDYLACITPAEIADYVKVMVQNSTASAVGDDTFVPSTETTKRALFAGSLPTAFQVANITSSASDTIVNPQSVIHYAVSWAGELFWSSMPPSPNSLVISMWLIRFLDSHLLTSIYRAIATEFAPETSISASRAVGLANQIFTSLGSLLAAMFVRKYMTC